MSVSNSGEWAEEQVQKFLKQWESATPYREYSRLPDSKSAGRITKAAAADFDYYCADSVATTYFGLIEVKETTHTHRIDRNRITQLARMRKRQKCGGTCFVLVYHTTLKVWRCLSVPWLMEPNDKGSWDLRSQPTFPTCGAALAASLREVFT